jgi:hypothetical protein
MTTPPVHLHRASGLPDEEARAVSAAASLGVAEAAVAEAPVSAAAGPVFGKARYPDLDWQGAAAANYTDASRGDGDITRVVIHVMQGSYNSAIQWFKDPRAQATAHYSVRNSDGHIGQSVREEDIAWHTGWWPYNQSTVGIEHEGYIDQTDFSEALYRSSAELCAAICVRRGIPIDRKHVIGHDEVPGCSTGRGGGSGCHTDPGRKWDWEKYMRYVKEAAAKMLGNAPQPKPAPGSPGVRVVLSADYAKGRQVFFGSKEGADRAIKTLKDYGLTAQIPKA